MTIASKSVRRSYYYYYKEKERKVNFRTRFFLMLANEFLAFEHSPLFFVDIIIHCSLLRTCRVRVEEKEEFLVYTVLWTLTCHPYLESATALSDYKEKERKVNFRTRFFLRCGYSSGSRILFSELFFRQCWHLENFQRLKI